MTQMILKNLKVISSWPNNISKITLYTFEHLARFFYIGYNKPQM